MSGKSHAKLMQALFPEDMGKVRKGDLGGYPKQHVQMQPPPLRAKDSAP